MSSESDTPNAGGARSGGPRTPRRTPASSAAATSSTTPRKQPAKRPAAPKSPAAAKGSATAKSPAGSRPAARRPATATAVTTVDPVLEFPAEPGLTEVRAVTETGTATDTDAEIDIQNAVSTDGRGDDAPAADAPAADAPTAATPVKKAPAKRPASPRKPVQRKPAPKPPASVDDAPEASAADAGTQGGATTAKRPIAPRTPSKPRTPSRLSRPAARAVPTTVVRDLDPTRISLSISGLTKKFGSTTAVAGIDIDVPQGSFYGIVGPNGAGKTTTLSMATGLLRPDGGSITVFGHDVWRDRAAAKRMIGVLPDRLRLFDRLTGRQLLHYSGTLRGLDSKTVRQRADDLTVAFGLEDAINRLVSDYSVGMTKKIALASSMIHSPRILVLDEPFESVDPVSASNVVEILEKYVAAGGTVVLSSHSMDMIQRVCDRVAIIVEGRVLSKGTVDEVQGGGSLEERFIELAGGRKSAEGMAWLLSSSD